MEMQLAPVCAAIDVGSNTIHVVVARCLPDTLEILADELELVRIGASVTASGEISPEKCQAALTVLKDYRALAESLGALRILVVATEAIRQARNSEAFIAEVKAETGLDVLLISGTAEAALTFFGATYQAGRQEHLAVMDLGGGSMELVFALDMRITWRTSVPLGSGWLHDHYLADNPPSAGQIKTTKAFLKTYVRDMHLTKISSPLIVTGGSANSLLYLTQQAFYHSPENRSLSREDLVRCQALLSALQAEDVARLYNQPLARAQVLLAGALIISNVMRQLHLREVLVSPHGIREGVLLAYARAGENWLAEVEGTQQPQETFVQSAHKILLERLQTMMNWTREVIKHEDIEAVHRMRVASRRLRAALDAYQICCDPGLFNRVYRQVKDAANALGSARDADVMLQYLYEQLDCLDEDEQAGVRWLMTRLQAYRQQQQQHLDDFLRHFDAEKLERQLKDSVRERTGK
ncbi:MAG TPA: CHAD domain-containing protein [Ktedonobacteraceae bacterium]